MEVSKAEFLLAQSEQRLRQRDFSGCRSYAIQALQSDGKLIGANQLLAVADIFIASQTSTPICNRKNPSLNYYSILQLSSRTQDSTLINQHYKKLLLLVHPLKHKSAIAADAYSLLDEAWSVLSNPKKKAQFDSDLTECYLNKHAHCYNAEEKSAGSFWTACPYCFCVYEYERVYVDCCLRCSNCKRPFHGLVIPPPPPLLVVPGKDEYYCCLGVHPLGFCTEGENGIGEKLEAMQVDSGGSVGNNSSREKSIGNVGITELEKRVKSSCERKSDEAEKRPMRRRKVVATNAKKITGTGIRVRRNVEAGNECSVGSVGETQRASRGGLVIDGLEYFEGDDEVFVGLELLDDIDDM